MDRQQDHPSAATVASTALLGSWMALLATRFLMTLPVASQIISIDAANNQIRWIDQARAADCLLHQAIEGTRLLSITNQHTVAMLYDSLAKDAEVLVWDPIQYREKCAHCDYDLYVWCCPQAKLCPQCQQTLRIHTQLTLDKGASVMALASLGIAPREILAVRDKGCLNWIELAL